MILRTRNSTVRTGFTYRLVLQGQMIVKVKFVVVHLFVPSLHMWVVYYWLMWQYFSAVNLLSQHTKWHKRELQLAKWLQLCYFLTFPLLGIAGRIIMESQGTLAWKGPPEVLQLSTVRAVLIRSACPVLSTSHSEDLTASLQKILQFSRELCQWDLRVVC